MEKDRGTPQLESKNEIHKGQSMLKLKTMQKRSRGFKSKNVFLALGHVEKLSC